MTTNELLTFRQARVEDREAVFAMIATVWDGTDYIPHVWDEWLADTAAPMIVGVIDERPVTLFKLTDLGPDEDWYGGVRVDPEFRGRGLARELTRHAVELSRERGKRTLRYQTSEQNQTMQRLGEELGFRLAYAPAWYGAPPIAAAPTWRPLPTQRLPQLLNDLSNSMLLELTGGLYTYGWTTFDMTETRLQEHLDRGTIVGLPGDRAWAIIDPSERGGYWLAHAEGPHNELTRLFRALRHHPEPFEGNVYVRAHVPPRTPLIPALLAASYEQGDHGACIYEYVLQ